VAPPAKKSSRPTGLLVGSLIVLAVMGSATAGAFLLSDQSKDKSGHASGSSGPVSSGAAPAAGGFPTEPMLVRIDTKPGWPTKCYADIGLYTPGSGSATTLVDGPNCDSLPERSPDRSKIAWTRKVDDKTEAWVMNADGSDQKMVTDKMAGGRVTWSPDGTRLAYMGKDADGVRQIYVITIGESTPKALTTDSSDKDDPMWSSTDRIAFWSKSDGVESIYTLDPARPKYQIKLTKDGVRAVDPEWSPDGSQIAYSRGAYPSGDIWVMGADGSNPHRLTKSPAHEMDPAWSQNGKWICYVSGTWDKPRIRAIRADGTGDREVSPTNKELGHPNW
jgi:Tol biopolymer transport system component